MFMRLAVVVALLR